MVSNRAVSLLSYVLVCMSSLEAMKCCTYALEPGKYWGVDFAAGITLWVGLEATLLESEGVCP